MEKTGRWMINLKDGNGKSWRCANCGGEGVYRVTYEDMYSKLTVTLCEECEKLGYGGLKLQSRLNWPIVA